MKNEFGHGLVYDGDVGSESQYTMWLSHRPVFRVYVDNKDPDLCVYVGRMNAPDQRLNTMMNAKMSLFSYPVGTEPHEVEVREHINSLDLQQRVYPSLPLIMADLFVPQEATL